MGDNDNPAKKSMSMAENMSLKVDNAGKAALSLMENTGKWAKEKPCQAGLVAAGVVTVCAPGVVFPPILHTLGWSMAGPKLGKSSSIFRYWEKLK